MSAVNSTLGWLVEGLLSPLSGQSAVIGLSLVSLLFAMGVLMIMRLTSNQVRLRAVKRALQACIYEVRLFRDDAKAMWRAVGEMLLHNFTYLRLSLVPALWMAVPASLVILQLQAHYGYDGLAPGQAAVVTVRVSSAAVRPAVELAVPGGVRVETAGVWVPSRREVSWRIVADRAGDFQLNAHLGGQVFEKSLRVSDDVVRLSPERVASGFLNQLVSPVEPPLPPGATIESIGITYRARTLRFFGWDVNWLVVFFMLTVVFVLVLRRRFNVVI